MYIFIRLIISDTISIVFRRLCLRHKFTKSKMAIFAQTLFHTKARCHSLPFHNKAGCQNRCLSNIGSEILSLNCQRTQTSGIITSNHEESVLQPFPQITICNANPYKMNMVDENLKKLMDDYSSSILPKPGPSSYHFWVSGHLSSHR